MNNNIGKNFLQLIDKHFPRSSNLHKIFSRNIVKVSYICLPNIQQITKRNNKKLTSRKKQKATDCSCRRNQQDSMQGKCHAESSLYKCVAKSNNIPPKTYVGTSEGD